MSLQAHVVTRLDGFTLDVSLDVPDGEVVAVLGPNGAGKTTLLRALAGLLPLTGGQVTLNGEVLEDTSSGHYVPTHQRHVGFVFQDLLLFDRMSVLENVAFGLRARGVDRRTARQQATDWLDRLDIAPLAKRRPRDLSRGQAQKVALARALATEPRLLLLDEPLASVDIDARESLRQELKTHLSSTPGVRLLVTHDPTDAEALATHTVTLSHGRSVSDCPP
jgi:molybdate transport system ATP-binding protein